MVEEAWKCGHKEFDQGLSEGEDIEIGMHNEIYTNRWFQILISTFQMMIYWLLQTVA